MAEPDHDLPRSRDHADTVQPSSMPPESYPTDVQDTVPGAQRTVILPRAPSGDQDEPWTRADSVLLEIAEVPPAGPGGASDMPTIGHIGRYALKYVVGEGGLGTVYAAHDPLLSRLIAIKTLHVDLPNEEREQFNALFLDEARAAGGLSHPHIVTVFDAGISPQGAYIAMELLKGKDLRQLLKTGWTPTAGQAALIVRRVADALAYAHHKGVVHRDVKPANIFMIGRTQPRVLDFGIARVAHQKDRINAILGSPYYMAPEQLRQEETDRRTDVYSLGVVLYELLTGERPYKGETLADIHAAVLNAPLVAPHQAKPGVPAGLSEIVMRAMAREPEHRYRSARSLASDLRLWINEHPQSLVDDDPAAEKRRRQQRRVVAALGAIGAGALAFGIWQAATVNGDAPAPAPTAAAAPRVAPPAAPKLAAATAAAAVAATPATAASAAPADAPRATDTQLVAKAADAGAPRAKPAPSTPNSSATPAPAAPTAPAAAKPAKDRDATKRAAAPAAAAATGVVAIAVSPWGQVEVDGNPAGTAPPLNRLTLPEGRHTITLRNDEFPPHQVSINVVPGETVTIKHRFGS